ncbi:MAG: hypothetical protein HZB31_11275 [Nitrospirae bacterium]|nr:hypothetical protein [Nitrospirota bacterium]
MDGNRVRLFGNNLGNSIEARDLRKRLNSDGHILVEIGSDPPSPPMDLIIQSNNGSRTWISNIIPPKLEELVLTLKKYKAESPDIIYTDHWLDTCDIKPYFAEFGVFSPKLLYCNAGDCNELGAVNRLSEYLNVPGIIQVSLKIQVEMQDLAKQIKPRRQHAIVLTRDSKNIFIMWNDTIHEVQVEPLYDIRTTGAGAIFSARIIDYLAKRISDWQSYILQAVSYSTAHTMLALKKNIRPYYL